MDGSLPVLCASLLVTPDGETRTYSNLACRGATPQVQRYYVIIHRALELHVDY